MRFFSHRRVVHGLPCKGWPHGQMSRSNSSESIENGITKCIYVSAKGCIFGRSSKGVMPTLNNQPMPNRGKLRHWQIYLDFSADLTSVSMAVPARTPTWNGGLFRSPLVCRPPSWRSSRSFRNDALEIINTVGLKQVVLWWVAALGTWRTTSPLWHQLWVLA